MTLNPEILTWARTTAGLSTDQAARALKFNDRRDRSAADRLRALESGAEEPSRNVLLSMAKAYRRPLLVFYLSEPPRTGNRGSDFRTLPGTAHATYDPVLDALIRDIRGRQTLLRGLLEDSEPTPVDYVASASIDDSVSELAHRMHRRLDFSLSQFRKSKDVTDAFSFLRKKVERTGSFVLLLGNLGSHHTNISVETFRGFAISDPIAPLIVINHLDAHASWSFTLLHEWTHLWLGTTGISAGPSATRLEQFCSDVAGEILLPTEELRTLRYLGTYDLNHMIRGISEFAAVAKLSRAMIAYRLRRANIVTLGRWKEIAEQLQHEWLSKQNADDQRSLEKKSGPSYYVLKRHRLGNALLDAVRRSLGEGTVTYTKAAQILGVKPRNVESLLHDTPSERRRG